MGLAGVKLFIILPKNEDDLVGSCIFLFLGLFDGVAVGFVSIKKSFY